MLCWEQQAAGRSSSPQGDPQLPSGHFHTATKHFHPLSCDKSSPSEPMAALSVLCLIPWAGLEVGHILPVLLPAPALCAPHLPAQELHQSSPLPSALVSTLRWQLLSEAGEGASSHVCTPGCKWRTWEEDPGSPRGPETLHISTSMRWKLGSCKGGTGQRHLSVQKHQQAL